MDFNVCQENICMNETIFSGVLEQSIELDYMLPDYCPNIFKVLKSSINTKITSERISGAKLTIDGIAYIKILYICEESYKVKQLEQRQMFTKTVDLKEDCDDGIVRLKPKCDYTNCRAVNQRRLDIRGAVSITVTVMKRRQLSIVSDCESMQLHKRQTELCDNRMFATKDFTIKEQLEIGHGKPPISDVLNYEAVGLATDYKLLANKIVCKGELLLHTLYLSEENAGKPEVIDHSIPISQILDIERIDEDYTCNIYFEVCKYDIDLQVDDSGECRAFLVELGIRMYCEACKNKMVQMVDDCYSTCYETNNNTTKMKLERMNAAINEASMIKNNIKLSQNDLSLIYDVMCETSNVSWKRTTEGIDVLCNLQMSILALDSENMPVAIDQIVPCEMHLNCKVEMDDIVFDPSLSISSTAYNIITVDEIELRVEVRISGMIYESCYSNAITQIEIDESRQKTRNDNAALRLYFADSGESIWEIAKKYNTSVNAILEQNSIEKENLTSRGMILIPIVD